MRSFVFALTLTISVGWGLTVMSSAPNAGAADPAIYGTLRAHALSTKAADIGLKPTMSGDAVYGVILDMALPKGTATLVGYDTGDASLYLSNGGGVIGGIGHSEVRNAAHEWVKAAQERLKFFSPTNAFPLPPAGQANIYVLTSRGVLTATGPEEEINSGRLPISPVWYAGQALLANLSRSTNKPTD